MNAPERHLRGPLETIEWSAGDGPAEATVVLLHGFGAPGDDLASLAPALAGGRTSRFVFPAAPLTPPDMAGWGGRAWWPLRMSEMLQQLSTGRFEQLFDAAPPGVDDARSALARCLDAVPVHGPLVLGGFSQGAMLAADAAMSGGWEAAGLVLLSGAPIDSAKWGKASGPAFVSHGRLDEVLPFACGEALRDRLTAAGRSVQFEPFDAGHTIPAAVVASLKAWLAAIA